MGLSEIHHSGYGIFFVALFILGAIIVFYLTWHLIFMVFFPAKRLALKKSLVEKTLVYTPDLGFTLADGGEKLEKKEEQKNE